MGRENLVSLEEYKKNKKKKKKKSINTNKNHKKNYNQPKIDNIKRTYGPLIILFIVVLIVTFIIKK